MRKQTLNKLEKNRRLFLNYKQLATTPRRRLVLYCANEAVKAVMPLKFMQDCVKRKGNFLQIKNKNVAIGRRIFIIGFGKAAASMAVALEKILGIKKNYCRIGGY